MSNIIRFRPKVSKPMPDNDPLGTIELAEDLLDGAKTGRYKTILSVVHYADDTFDVIQSGNLDNLQLMGALQFAALDIHAFCRDVRMAEAEERGG